MRAAGVLVHARAILVAFPDSHLNVLKQLFLRVDVNLGQALNEDADLGVLSDLKVLLGLGALQA